MSEDEELLELARAQLANRRKYSANLYKAAEMLEESDNRIELGPIIAQIRRLADHAEQSKSFELGRNRSRDGCLRC